MNNGIIVFAHNNRQVDYGLLSLISGGLAKKNLQVPVSLISDSSTIEWMRESGIYKDAIRIFDKIILSDRPVNDNFRTLHDGNISETIPFINSNRSSVWDLTPYDTTLLIDSDYLIFSNTLSNFWNLEYDILISPSMNDIQGNRAGYLDKWISETGISMYWATTVMFKKNNRSKIFFDLVQYIKQNYNYYSDLFRFDSRQYRNDISFSIAKHILDGYEYVNTGSLPSVLTVIDKDILYQVKDSGKLIFLLGDLLNSEKFTATSIEGVDVHVMNKQSIVRNSQQLLKLI
jgi:hypothetical protein